MISSFQVPILTFFVNIAEAHTEIDYIRRPYDLWKLRQVSNRSADKPSGYRALIIHYKEIY